MEKAIAKTIVILCSMFFSGILVGSVFARFGGTALIFGLSLGAVSGLIFSGLLLAYNN